VPAWGIFSFVVTAHLRANRGWLRPVRLTDSLSQVWLSGSIPAPQVRVWCRWLALATRRSRVPHRSPALFPIGQSVACCASPRGARRRSTFLKCRAACCINSLPFFDFITYIERIPGPRRATCVVHALAPAHRRVSNCETNPAPCSVPYDPAEAYTPKLVRTDADSPSRFIKRLVTTADSCERAHTPRMGHSVRTLDKCTLRRTSLAGFFRSLPNGSGP
jgi:hypothetical protein